MSAAATDADAGDTLTYSIVAGHGDTYYDIESSSGIIKTRTTLPFSAGSTVETIITVQAMDTCSNPVTASFTVTSTNVAPSFTNLPATYILSENVTTATSLLELGLSDHPSTVTICCSLIGTSPTTTNFELITSGSTHTLWLKSDVTLEHDTVSSYNLFVCCDDGTLSSTSNLVVSVTNADAKAVTETPTFVLIGLIVCLIPVGILFGLSCALMVVTIYIR